MLWNASFPSNIHMFFTFSVTFLIALQSTVSNANGDDPEEFVDNFFVKPGAGKLSIQAELKNYVCKFSYAAQGGTHEEWSIAMQLVAGEAVTCAVERSGSSYLFFESFDMELTGPSVALQGVDLKNQNRGNIPLGPEEFVKGKTSVSSVAGKFKNHLERAYVFSPLARGEL